jgi:proline iminopeptidase
MCRYQYLIIALFLMSVGCQSDQEAIFPVSEGLPVEEGYFPGADSLQLFYRIVGQGPETALYLHGGPLNMNDGGYELDSLSQGRRLLAFDQRSGGKSELVNDPDRLTVEYYIRDIEALYSHFNLNQITLIGQSWGSGLAVLYASQHPEQIERLLLLSPMAPARIPFQDERVISHNAAIGEEGLARLDEISKAWDDASDSMVVSLWREQIGLTFRGYVSDITALERMHGDYGSGSAASIRHQTVASSVVNQTLGNWDFRPSMTSLNMPVLVVEGEETKMPLNATREWARVLPNSRFLLIPGGSHLVWLEGAEFFFPAAQTFLSGDWPDGAEVVK